MASTEQRVNMQMDFFHPYDTWHKAKKDYGEK